MAAVASSCSLLCFLSLLSLLPLISTTTTIPLSHFHKNPPPIPYQNLNYLASSSLTRAKHLKNPHTTPSTTTTSIFSHSYGAYSISLSFGTPPQTLPFLLDTGSDFTWFPCTHHYRCNNCSFSNSTTITSFIPKLSSSSKILGCLNPKCSWIHRSNSNNCTNQICPPYLIFYGSGNTGGLALSETLNFSNRTVRDFLVGCSVFSSYQPAGIVGFGRGPSSLPTQLGLNKFSYCLLSHRFDDTNKHSSLVLYNDSEKTQGLLNLSYTNFVKNPKLAEKPEFSVYYYVALRQISVGGRHVKVPYKYLNPQPNGSGGTVVDSGTTFTFMSRGVFELVAAEFRRQVKHERAVGVEALTGLRPCFNVSKKQNMEKEMVSFPELRFHFKGGAEMVLPLENILAMAGEGDGEEGGSDGAVCLTLVTDGVAGEKQVAGGPAIILGNFQMQNFYVEYDLRNERFGFRQQSCN